MMASEKLQIILDADWRGKSEVQGANRDINKLDDSVGKAGATLGEFAALGAVALAAIGTAAKLAWEQLGKGAALVQSREQFDNLAKSINTTADVMMGKLKDATNGMVSDAKLIAGAGQIISLGLADTEEGVVRLATLVTKLGWDMQQVIMTFANNSVMRLDALGLSVEDVAAKSKILEAQGYSTDKAFDMAVIQAGEDKLALLGDTSETTAGDIQRLQTAWENARDAFSIGFAEGAAEDISLLSGELNIATEAVERYGRMLGGLVSGLAIERFGVEIAVDQLELAVHRGAITQNEYNETLGLLKFEVKSVADILGFVEGRTDAWHAAIERSVSGLDDQIAAASSADIILRNYAAGADVATDATWKLVGAMGAISGLSFRPSRDLPDVLSLTQAQFAAGQAYTDANQYQLAPSIRDSGAAVTLEQEMGLIANASDRATAALEDSADAADNLTGGIGGIGVAAATAAEQMAALARETGAFFDQARRSEDFDPAEAFYQAALSAGASAEQLQQLLVTTGLETPERAQEIYNESIQRQLAKQAGTAYAGGDNLDMLWQGVQAGMENPAWAQQVTQQVSETTNVGGITMTVIINGNISGEDLDMTVDNMIGEASDQIGNTPGTV